MTTQTFELLEVENGKPIKMWTRGVPVEPEARQQLMNTAQMPFVFKHMAVMPDVHLGKGSTIGSVIPTKGAIIPAAVGVDLGCGMSAVRTSLRASDLPDHLFGLRSAIEKAVPHGRTSGRSGRDKGAWETAPAIVDQAWSALEGRFDLIIQKHPRLEKSNNRRHLGTLGTGNHFVEVCLDEADHVWVMLHTGSRGVGNAIGTYFIEKAREEMRRHMVNLPDRDLAYLREGTSSFDDYVEAVEWAQDFAKQNRAVMMLAVLDAVRSIITKPFESRLIAVDCHHNYVERGTYFGEDILLTRKGAVSAQKGQMGIIPGSMGAKSFIVRGLGNEEAFCSCSHGAGRVMSRTKAKAVFTVEDQVRATAHVECRKDAAVIDEIPMAYKDIDAVMAAQRDLVEVVHTLRQVVCVKG
ncbi:MULTISPECIES: RtcB family protein [unclassified Pseudomonas]|uniref:RtcB family protein n=1 Tax=unclassified Pseudomonas TaxID=196821 RepID=UPI00119C0B3D|nr:MULTISPECIES: RtcB family protein [unclassified Pseudomonas]TWC18437.1 tRNA-splicing ligase RtcB [Pseudomonas sp. SJZ075]TWC23441.1 tRNA-splicing ligase RtcB [Pseudomonas sp. SJZ074]TWC34792.1 tRNA-splicing ligase RtcB [Pseudomonas sp. SJZ078]TWC40611.1 tRNA-splicing ligase RtcB [Pseudomonas sp. SJZ085]TWC55462.1 tRNA-splicing ligase RtcB [Pseudomonas sp. SJZ124]